MKEVGRRRVLCFGLASGTLSLLGRDANADDSPKRKRSTASVSSFPYSVPLSGQALLIGNNFAADVRPPSHSAHQWNYSLFAFYGGGTFVEDYSAGGAYVIAGSGGHKVPPNFGGCLFDFADATWKRIDNANGMPWMNRDLESPEINRIGEINYPGVSDGIPAPRRCTVRDMRTGSIFRPGYGLVNRPTPPAEGVPIEPHATTGQRIGIT
ncbi:MAG: hypothetical protein M3N35_10110 [Candidatus Binatota bacterium]|nr:hypothetical protein [Candidatus Binatota bacterium]